MDTIVENNTRKFYASIGKIILGVLVTAILVGLIFWLFIDILSDFTNFIPFFIYRLKIPICFFTGFLIAVIVQILRFTIVTVSDEKVCVKRLLKKYTLELEKYYFYEKTEYKKHSISMLVFTKHKRSLILKDTSGKIIKIRLYSFTSGSLYDLIDEIHKRETEAISDERKAEVIRDSWDNERRFNVSSEDIIRSEWKKVGIIIAVWVSLAVCLTILLIFTDNDSYKPLSLFLWLLYH